VESPVNGCTQAFHRNVRTWLETRDKIVDTASYLGPGGARFVPNLGRLALFFVEAGVDGAVELVFLQLAFDVRA
jgi:hypothetical protein